jgi:invasion protein IalB
MNFRMLAAPVWPRGRVFALFAATVVIIAPLLASSAQAQAPAPRNRAQKAPPRAAPAPTAQAAPPAAGAPAAGQPPEPQQVQLIYAPWTKFCLKGQDANAKQVCFTGKDGRIESGQPVIAAVIIEPEGEQKKILRVTLPLGMQLIHGTRVIIDNNPPQQSPYVICFANGCMSDYDLTPEMLANMKKGQNLIVQAINSNGAPLTLPLPAAASQRPMTARPPTRRCLRKLRRSCRRNCRSALRKPARSSRPAQLRPTPRPNRSRSLLTGEKALQWDAFFVEKVDRGGWHACCSRPQRDATLILDPAVGER